MTVETAWVLSIAWYHDRLDEAFHGRSIDDAVAIFARMGLTGPFWSVSPPTPTP